VPAAAVIPEGLALLGIVGRKGCLGNHQPSPPKPKGIHGGYKLVCFDVYKNIR